MHWLHCRHRFALAPWFCFLVGSCKRSILQTSFCAFVHFQHVLFCFLLDSFCASCELTLSCSQRCCSCCAVLLYLCAPLFRAVLAVPRAVFDSACRHSKLSWGPVAATRRSKALAQRGRTFRQLRFLAACCFLTIANPVPLAQSRHSKHSLLQGPDRRRRRRRCELDWASCSDCVCVCHVVMPVCFVSFPYVACAGRLCLYSRSFAILASGNLDGSGSGWHL